MTKLERLEKFLQECEKEYQKELLSFNEAFQVGNRLDYMNHFYDAEDYMQDIEKTKEDIEKEKLFLKNALTNEEVTALAFDTSLKFFTCHATAQSNITSIDNTPVISSGHILTDDISIERWDNSKGVAVLEKHSLYDVLTLRYNDGSKIFYKLVR